MGFLVDLVRGIDAMELVRTAFRAIDAVLPALPAEMVGSLHTIALAGIAYAFDVPIVSFKGERVRVFGQFVTTRDAILALLVTFVVLAVYGWWSQRVYDLFVLTGWQAFGVVCMETTAIILSKSQRNVDRWTAALFVVGATLFVLPWLQ